MENQNQPSLEDLQLLNNELMRLDRVIEDKSYVIDQLLKKKSRNFDWKASVNKPKRYSVEFIFNVSSQINSIPLTRSFVVSKGTIFRPRSIDSALKVQLFTEAGDVSTSLTTLTLPIGNSISAGIAPFRNTFFAAFIAISDSGSDREWQNAPFPDSFLLSGLVAPFYMGERAVLMQGTEVFITVTPFSIQAQTSIPSSILQYNFHIGFSGHEEYL